MARHCPYIYRRRDVGYGEPMEVNAQQVRPRRGWEYAEEPAGESEVSGTEEEEEDLASSVGEPVGPARRPRRVAAGRKVTAV